MKRNIKIAALALTAMALMAACNNNTKTEEVIDTMPVIDTTVVEEIIDSVPVVDTPEVAPAPAKKAAAKKTPIKKVAEDVKTVKTVTLETRKDINEIKGDLKEVKNATGTETKKLDPNKKPSAADAFKKN
jgi:hypothetical protein